MAEPGLRRVHYVAKHYSTLRGGVIRAVLAPCLLTGVVIEVVSHDRASGGLRALILLANLLLISALGLTLVFRCRRWLDARFGRVQSNNLYPPMIGDFACQVGFFGSWWMDAHYGAGSGYPSATFLFFAVVGLWFCVRLWPHSLHYAVPTAVALGFALQHAALRGEQAIEVWEVNASITSLLAWTAAGLIDLTILFKFLTRRSEGDALAVDA